MRIGAFDTDEHVVVVGEIGNNHEGDVDAALELVDEAAAAGAHAVKLQAIDPPRLVRPEQAERIAQLERFRLSREEFATVARRAHDRGMAFLCTPFDLDAVEWLAPLVDAYKIASGDNDLDALIGRAAQHGKPVIVSTGMGAIAAARHSAEIVAQHGAPFAALHCVSSYPTPREAAHLATIPALAAELGCTVGYSDHTLGVEAWVLAVGLGARILEKHITLAHDYSAFRDHQLSAEPAELKLLCDRVAEAEAMLGDPARGVLDEEQAVAAAARRSICAGRDLPAGHVLAADDLTWLRPADGLAPGNEDQLVGRALRRAVAYGEKLSADHVGEPAGDASRLGRS